MATDGVLQRHPCPMPMLCIMCFAPWEAPPPDLPGWGAAAPQTTILAFGSPVAAMLVRTSGDPSKIDDF